MAQAMRDGDDRRRKRHGRLMHILRWDRGWNLRDLEERSGVPIATLSRYERKGVIPSDRLESIAGAFDLSLQEFVTLAERYSQTGLSRYAA